MTRFLFHVENKLEVILPTRENGYFHSAPVAKKEREGIWMIPQWLQGGLMGSVGSGILCVIQAMWPKAPNFTSLIYTCLVCVIRRFTYMVMKRPWHILVKNRCWWVCIMEQDGLNSESDYERLWMPSKKVGPFAAESGDSWKSLNREVTRTSQCIKEVALPTVHDRWIKMRSRGRGTFQEAITKTLGFLDGSVGKEFACGTGDTRGFNPWVGKIPWSKKCQLTPVFLPGKFLWQRSPAGYSPWGQSKESDMTEHMTHDMSQNPGVRAMAMGMDRKSQILEHWWGSPATTPISGTQDTCKGGQEGLNPGFILSIWEGHLISESQFSYRM